MWHRLLAYDELYPVFHRPQAGSLCNFSVAAIPTSSPLLETTQTLADKLTLCPLVYFEGNSSWPKSSTQTRPSQSAADRSDVQGNTAAQSSHPRKSRSLISPPVLQQPAQGRYAPKEKIVDWVSNQSVSVIQGTPNADDFLAAIIREMKIRFYQKNTIRNYSNAIRGFLNWLCKPPHRATSEDVREYLAFLVDAGAGSSWVSTNLSAIRTAFDKMCLRQITAGLRIPRHPKRASRSYSANWKSADCWMPLQPFATNCYLA